MSAASSAPPLTLIVAATVKNGIGKNGTLPWPMLKKEMAYFARVTKRVVSAEAPSATTATSQQQAQNVVIMGRKTWDSIPPRFRPLPARTNLVISRQDSLESIPASLIAQGNVLVAKDIASGLAALHEKTETGSTKPIGRVFVIGGAAIYKAALGLQNARRVLLTRVQGEWDCDTDFPIDLDREEGWKRKNKEELEKFVGEEFEGGSACMDEVVGGTKHEFEFMLYERT